MKQNNDWNVKRKTETKVHWNFAKSLLSKPAKSFGLLLQLKKEFVVILFCCVGKSFSPLAEKDCCQQQQNFCWSSSKTVSTKNAKMWEFWTVSEQRSQNKAIPFVQIWRKTFSATSKKDFWIYFCATGGKDFLLFAATKTQILQQLFFALA